MNKRQGFYILITGIIFDMLDLAVPIFYPNRESNIFFHLFPTVFFIIKIIILPIALSLMYFLYFDKGITKGLFLFMFFYFLGLNLWTLLNLI